LSGGRYVSREPDQHDIQQYGRLAWRRQLEFSFGVAAPAQRPRLALRCSRLRIVAAEDRQRSDSHGLSDQSPQSAKLAGSDLGSLSIMSIKCIGPGMGMVGAPR
jgi:hypothetical protein